MIIQQKVLAQKIKQLKAFVPKNPTLPVLASILVDDGKMIANSIEYGCCVNVDEAKGDRFLIPQKVFDIILSLPDAELRMEASDREVKLISDGGIEHVYLTEDPSTFPLPGTEAGEISVGFRADSLMENLRRVLFAVSKDSPNIVMGCMAIQGDGSYINFTGLDGHTIATTKIAGKQEFELLIPRRVIELITGMRPEGKMEVSFNRKMVTFKTEDSYIFARLSVSKKYFNWKEMMEGQPKDEMVVNRMELVDACMRAKLCSYSGNKVPVILSFRGNEVEISSRGDGSFYKETVTMLDEISEPLRIGMDPDILANMLRAIQDENVVIGVTSPKSPVFILGYDKETTFKALGLPVTIAQ